MMRLDQKLKVQLPLALGLSLVSSYLITLPGYAEISNDVSPNTPATTAPASVSIKDIYLNENKQLVVEFDNPAHIIPTSPQVRDYPGQQHDIVLEFSQTSFAVDKAPKAKALLDNLMKVYPSLNSVAYATANDGTKARIRIGVLPNTSAHPALASIGEGSAIINLDLPTDNKNDNTNQVAATSPAVIENKETTVASKNTPASNADAGVTTKTVNSIKGAWRSSLKLGHNQVNKIGQISKLSDKINPIGKFGHPKNTDKLSMPANTDIASSVTQKDPSASDQAAPVTVATLPTTTDTVNAPSPASISSNAVNANAVETANSNNQPSVASTTTATEIGTAAANPSASLPATPAASATSDIANSANISELKPAIKANESQPVEQLSSSTINTSESAPSITSVEKTQIQLPRISTAVPEETPSAAKNEPLITPLSVEQVLQEKANLPAEQQKPSPAATTAEAKLSQPPITKEPSSENSAATSEISTKEVEALKQTDAKETAIKEAIANLEDSVKKDGTTNLASAIPNSLDKLTNAAINNHNGTEDTTNTPSTATPKDAIPLKVQKASIGGKDYLPPKFSDDAIDHYNKAVRFHLSGKLPEAVAEYKAAIEADSKIAEAYSNLGLIYNQQRKYDQAMTEFHKALLVNPNDAITYNGIGAAMRAKNNMAAAKKNWKTAITLDPNLASAHYNLGTAYELEKDMEQALVEYKEAVKHDDKLGEAYYRMGLVLQKMNNKNLALEEYKHAIKISQQANYAPDAKKRINLLSQSKRPTM